jgi:hypothetical protein
VFGLDPSPWLLARAQAKAPRAPCPVHLLEGSAERIPLAAHSMNTVMLTWTGCSIPVGATVPRQVERVDRAYGNDDGGCDASEEGLLSFQRHEISWTPIALGVVHRAPGCV